jgi:hypothetical protein
VQLDNTTKTTKTRQSIKVESITIILNFPLSKLALLLGLMRRTWQHNKGGDDRAPGGHELFLYGDGESGSGGRRRGGAKILPVAYGT